MLPPLEFFSPQTLPEACRLLAEEPGARCVLAGGTDLVLQLQNGERHARGIVDLSRLPGLRGIARKGKDLIIGSMVTFAELANSQLVKTHARALAQAAAAVGSPQIRNQGTIGGNIANASPAADTVTALEALEAILEVAGLKGTRLVPITDVLVGAGHHNLATDEIITKVILPLKETVRRSSFIKLGRRNALAIARLSMAAVIALDGGVIKEARVALGAVAPNPFRAQRVEEIMTGRELNDKLADEVALTCRQVVTEVLGRRPSAPYKREAVGGLARRLLKQLREEEV